MTIPTTKQIKEVVNCSTTSKKGDVYTFRKSFFYAQGNTSKDFAEKVIKKLETLTQGTDCSIELVDKGEVWKPFKGGASVASQSHWFAKVKIK